MEIKDIYQKMECSKEDKEKIYRAILQKRRRNFAGSHFMKAAVIALCLLVGGTTAYAAVHLLTANEACLLYTSTRQRMNKETRHHVSKSVP